MSPKTVKYYIMDTELCKLLDTNDDNSKRAETYREFYFASIERGRYKNLKRPPVKEIKEEQVSGMKVITIRTATGYLISITDTKHKIAVLSTYRSRENVPESEVYSAVKAELSKVKEPIRKRLSDIINVLNERASSRVDQTKQASKALKEQTSPENAPKQEDAQKTNTTTTRKVNSPKTGRKLEYVTALQELQRQERKKQQEGALVTPVVDIESVNLDKLQPKPPTPKEQRINLEFKESIRNELTKYSEALPSVISPVRELKKKKLNEGLVNSVKEAGRKYEIENAETMKNLSKTTNQKFAFAGTSDKLYDVLLAVYQKSGEEFVSPEEIKRVMSDDSLREALKDAIKTTITNMTLYQNGEEIKIMQIMNADGKKAEEIASKIAKEIASDSEIGKTFRMVIASAVNELNLASKSGSIEESISHLHNSYACVVRLNGLIATVSTLGLSGQDITRKESYSAVRGYLDYVTNKTNSELQTQKDKLTQKKGETKKTEESMDKEKKDVEPTLNTQKTTKRKKSEKEPSQATKRKKAELSVSN